MTDELLLQVLRREADTIYRYDAKINKLEEALRECRDRFAFYVQSHRAKRTKDGDKKAVADLTYITKINAILGGKP